MDASLNTGSIDNNFVYDTYEKNLIQNYLVQVKISNSIKINTWTTTLGKNLI